VRGGEEVGTLGRRSTVGCAVTAVSAAVVSCEVAHLLASLATLQVNLLPLAERSCSHLLRSLAGLILDSQA
jgi:hypothetical protein